MHIHHEFVTKVNVTNTNELTKKADYKIKLKEIENKIPNHDKYLTFPKFNKFSTTIFDEKLKQRKFKLNKSVTKSDIADSIKYTYFDAKPRNINNEITSNKTKHLEAERKLIYQKKIYKY